MQLSPNNLRGLELWSILKLGASLNGGEFTYQDIITTIQALDGTKSDIERIITIESIKRTI